MSSDYFFPSVEKKNLILAYGLWGLGFIGLNGMQCMYTGQYKKGSILLLTLGGLGVAQLVDLFTIRATVNKLNRENGFNIENQPAQAPASTPW